MKCTQTQEQGASISSQPMVKKRLWSPEEDEQLINHIVKNGLLGCSWSHVAKQAGLHRCGKSCRLRWINYLRPGLKRCAFSPEEKQLIVHLHSILGHRWSQIAAHLPGRTDNDIKNFWHSCIKKKLTNLRHSLPGTESSPNKNRLSSSYTSYSQSNANNKTKSNIPLQFDHTCNTNSLSSYAYETYTSIHCEKPLNIMPKRYQSLESFNVVTPSEDVFDLKYEPVPEPNNVFLIDPDCINNQLISYSPLWIDSTSTHTYESSSQGFTFPSLQAQGHSYKTANSERCDQLIGSWTTLPQQKVPDSAINALGCTFTIPAVVDISDSLKGKIENDGELIHENQNEIIIDNCSLTPSSVITTWTPCHCFSNDTEFTDHYSGAYITAHNVEDYVARQPCGPDGSLCQFSAPAIIPADVNQYSGIQAWGQDNGKNPVNLKPEEVDVGEPTCFRIHAQHSYQLPQIGGVKVGDQPDCSTIPGEDPPILSGDSERRT